MPDPNTYHDRLDDWLDDNYDRLQTALATTAEYWRRTASDFADVTPPAVVELAHEQAREWRRISREFEAVYNGEVES